MSESMREDRRFTQVHEVFPNTAEAEAFAKVREIASWIEGLPTSGLPYVEIGFEALHQDLIQKIVNH